MGGGQNVLLGCCAAGGQNDQFGYCVVEGQNEKSGCCVVLGGQHYKLGWCMTDMTGGKKELWGCCMSRNL